MTVIGTDNCAQCAWSVPVGGEALACPIRGYKVKLNHRPCVDWIQYTSNKESQEMVRDYFQAKSKKAGQEYVKEMAKKWKTLGGENEVSVGGI